MKTIYPKKMTAVIHDLTAIRQAEEEKKLLDAQLQQSKKMEAIGTLAGGIAHDFNNILCPIIGYSEILKDDVPDDSHLQKYINRIFDSAMRAKDLAEQILTFSRQEGQDTKPLKLQPIIKEALKLLRSSIPSTIDIHKDIDPDCGVVTANLTKIHQIVMNLATNAYHAMEETGGSLKVHLKQVRLGADQSVSPDLMPGEYALLKVSDTGVGIEKDIMDKIFDPYFTTKDTQKGTGLGLSIVQGIVKGYNGGIRIFSQPGKGTEIQVYLPIIDREINDNNTTRSESVQGGSERILLVDDEVDIVKMEKEVLERLGYRVATCTTGVEALEVFKKNPDSFDLIMTDMSMPGMTGDQLAMEIKNSHPKMPVIICTGFNDRINEEKCRAMGIQGYVRKPMIRRKMAKIIRSILDKSEESRINTFSCVSF